MSDLRIEPGAGEAIRDLHLEGAELIEGTGESAPGTVDAGPGSSAISAILSNVRSEASDLAAVHRAVATVMGQVVDQYDATDESIRDAFDQVTRGLPADEGGR